MQHCTLQIPTYHFEMSDPSLFRPKLGFEEALELKQITKENFFFNFLLWLTVGLPWKWHGRFSWSFQDWKINLGSSEIKSFLAFHQSHLIGYFELNKNGKNVEIKYIGILPVQLNKKLGGILLSHAVSEAWKWGAKKIHLHTCILDHENAINNYRARGFRLTKKEWMEEDYLSDEAVAAKIGELFLSYTKEHEIYPDLTSIEKKLKGHMFP
jgi:N-acetylglutamate synthase-like GNAT family acetyltransferase